MTEIEKAVKTAYAKYGLKAATITKLVNKIETNISALGTLEPDKLTEAITAQITQYEALAELTQTEADATRARIPGQAKTETEKTDPVDLEGILKRVTSPLEKQLLDMKAKLDAQDKDKANASRLAAIKNLMKAKGATKEPVLQVVATADALDEALTDEQIADKLLLTFDSKMTEFYGDGHAPRLPEQGKSQVAEQGQKHTESVLDKAVAGMGITSKTK